MPVLQHQRGWDPAGGLDGTGEVGQQAGIERIGFGALSAQLGKGVRWAGVDQADGKARLRQGQREGPPVGTGGFHDPQALTQRGQRPHLRHPRGVGVGLRGKRPSVGGRLAGGASTDGGALGGNLDADKRGVGHDPVSVC